MAVYKLTLVLPQQPPFHLVAKIPRQRRIVYTHQQTADQATHRLLDRLVTLAAHLARYAPGLFPRSGGVWHGRSGDDTPQHLLIEEFIPGVSAERLKLTYEAQLAAGQLSTAAYQRRRQAAERLAVAAFVRLWDCLGRRTFTSDPSPWNVLIRSTDTPDGAPPGVTIIDLHSLEDEVDLAYVMHRLTAIYGMRREMVEAVILPGLFDALGREEGRTLLRAELPHLEAQARQMRRNLGVDLHQPLLTAIRDLG